MAGWRLLAVAGLLCSSLLGGVASAGAAEAPLADAGLDQTATNGTTVYLDAGGSIDPEGSITATRWTITAPDGSTVAPSCPTCVQTRFTPTRTGRYSATVTVTNGDGNTAMDTLYVTVEAPRGPTVDISGPTETAVGVPTAVTVTASADGADLRRLDLSQNGTVQANRTLAGDTANETLTQTFATPGTYRVRATVRDRLDYARRASLVVRVVASGGGGGGGGGGNICDDGENYAENGATDRMSCYTHRTDFIIGDYVANTKNGAYGDGIWLYDNDVGEVVQKATAEETEMLQNSGGGITLDEINEHFEENHQPDTRNPPDDGNDDTSSDNGGTGAGVPPYGFTSTSGSNGSSGSSSSGDSGGGSSGESVSPYAGSSW